MTGAGLDVKRVSCKTAISRRPYMADNTESVVIMIKHTWRGDKHELTGTALVSYSLPNRPISAVAVSITQFPFPTRPPSQHPFPVWGGPLHRPSCCRAREHAWLHAPRTERHRAAIDGAAGAVGALGGSGGSEAKKIQSTRGRGRSCYSSRPTSAICRVMHMSPSITRETLPLKYCSSLYL